jgi:hypothetical protein
MSAITFKEMIAVELVEVGRSLGAKSDLLTPIGDWGDTRPDHVVVDRLRAWNDRNTPGAWHKDDADLKEQFRHEIYHAFEQLGAGGDVLWMLGNWGDIDNDAKTLANLREYRQMFLA